MDYLNELKSSVASKKVTIGSKETLRNLKSKKIKLVVIAQNCPEAVKKEIISCKGASNIGLEEFNGSAKQLGLFCGKPFHIAAIGILTETKK